MKVVAVTFGTAFAVFFVLGFIRARTDVRQPDFLREQIVERLHLFCADQRPRHCDLIYEAGSLVDVYSYDLDKNELKESPGAAFGDIRAGRSELVRFPIDEAFTLALLGGTTGGVTVWSAIGQAKTKVIAAVLGGVTGFFWGYKSGVETQTLSSSSAAVRALLSNQEEWGDLAARYVDRLSLMTFSAASILEDKAASDKYKSSAVSIAVSAKSYRAAYRELLEAKHRGASTEAVLQKYRIYPLGSGLFLVAGEQLNEAATVARVDPKRLSSQIDRAVEPAWISWWWLGTVSLIMCVGIVIVAALQHRS